MNSRVDCPITILLVMLAGLLFLNFGLYGMTGTVYIDQNENLQYDEGDVPFAGAVVSDGFTTTLTDEQGVFTLTANSEAKFVFLSTPTATKPLASWYRAVSEETSDFPLARIVDSSPLVFVQLSDTHYATDPAEFKKAFVDRRMKVLPKGIFDKMVPEVNNVNPDFVILTGDIIADAKRPNIDLVDKWMNYMGTQFASRFSAPFYAAVGNHDVMRDEAVDKAIYERYFGPTYYSFNVKRVHFVVLDTQQLSGTHLLYTVTSSQLGWLEEDLAAIDSSMPVIVFCHEPTPDWADTPENSALLSLLSRVGITALLDGHWHINFVVQNYPFYELTSGAVCASWWEGESTDGSKFGYRIFEFNRGRLESIWREIGTHNVELREPAQAVATWNGSLQAATWGKAASASWSMDDGAVVDVNTCYNGMWTVAYGNLNFSVLGDGYHSLKVEFHMNDGAIVSYERSVYVQNPDIDIKEMKLHSEAFLGKTVGVAKLQVKAIMPGEAISTSDGSATIILNRVPFVVQKGDTIGVVGIYLVHSATPIKVYDPVFFTKYAQKSGE